jgi:hypothetical protein
MSSVNLFILASLPAFVNDMAIVAISMVVVHCIFKNKKRSSF